MNRIDRFFYKLGEMIGDILACIIGELILCVPRFRTAHYTTTWESEPFSENQLLRVETRYRLRYLWAFGKVLFPKTEALSSKYILVEFELCENNS